jgi:hypothetical protein
VTIYLSEGGANQVDCNRPVSVIVMTYNEQANIAYNGPGDVEKRGKEGKNTLR